MVHESTEFTKEGAPFKSDEQPQIDAARILRDQANHRLNEAKENLLEAQQDLEETQHSRSRPHPPLMRKGNTLKRLTRELRAGSAPKLSVPIPSDESSQD